ncbi:MAG: 3'-5' exonuclease [Campylobacteraceae bacterium]|jgi:DNA polymerase-3 subunit epsilon|nr:3'-5' exonuclease [Campylobacteraceae bacterium]MBT3882813.1 3'-5' exonuclease [Campylobacteraceae bacterium]MBT4030175.1 3'-5' exonuclease [Campylobacteraceae bacterium]MBT4179012.1 3'-5' exonuclease [Campylobacteraceae bacterium]MBT4573185.1 3'-5' exonuclease [Campylobacteraceae bacterium]
MFNIIKNYFNKKSLKDKSYSYLFEPYNDDEYVCFDCETTGLNTKTDDIISIGAVIIKNNKILVSKKFEKFIKPKTSLDAQSIKIHQIRECDLDDAKDIDDVITQFLEFIGNRPLVGYYLEFDIAMINKYVKQKIGSQLPNKQIEVSAMYYDKVIGRIPQGNIDLRFDVIMNKLGLPILSKHDAINDAVMTAMIFLKLNKST